MKQHLSFSNVVAVLALVFALGGGTAYAATLITSKNIEDGTIQTKDLAAKTRKALQGKTGPAGSTGAAGAPGTPGAPGAKGETGTRGDAGTSGVKGDTGAPGATGDTGAPGPKGDVGPASVIAYGRVGGGSGGLSQNSSNVSVASGGTGIYCLTVTDAVPNTRVPVATVDYQTTTAPEQNGSVLARTNNGGNCPKSTDFQFRTYRTPTVTSGSNQLQGQAVGAADVGFTFLIR